MCSYRKPNQRLGPNIWPRPKQVWNDCMIDFIQVFVYIRLILWWAAILWQCYCKAGSCFACCCCSSLVVIDGESFSQSLSLITCISSPEIVCQVPQALLTLKQWLVFLLVYVLWGLFFYGFHIIYSKWEHTNDHCNTKFLFQSYGWYLYMIW